MKYFFDDKVKQVELIRILKEWVGTPYRHHCGVKRMGADCIYFVARVLEEVGVIGWRKGLIPDYPKDWHEHNTREILKEALEKEVRGQWIMRDGAWVGAERFENGDIVLAHFGKACSHSMIYCDGHIFHAVNNIGVLRTVVSERMFRKRMRFVYRILK